MDHLAISAFPYSHNMGSAQKILCCKDTRWGTMVCAFYTTAMAVTCICMYLIRYIGLGTINESAELRTVAYLSFIMYTILFFISIILVAGAFLDRRILFLPWIAFMIALMIFEVGTMTTMVVVETRDKKRLDDFDLAILAVWMVRILLNTYSIACVTVQYSKLLKGKGTYEYYKRKRRRRRMQRMMMQSTNQGFSMDDENMPPPNPYPPPYAEDPPPYSGSEEEPEANDEESPRTTAPTGGSDSNQTEPRSQTEVANEQAEPNGGRIERHVTREGAVTTENEVQAQNNGSTPQSNSNRHAQTSVPAVAGQPPAGRRPRRVRGDPRHPDRLPRDLQRVRNIIGNTSATDEPSASANANANAGTQNSPALFIAPGAANPIQTQRTSAQSSASPPATTGSEANRSPERRAHRPPNARRSAGSSGERRRAERSTSEENRRREVQLLPDNLNSRFRQWLGY